MQVEKINSKMDEKRISFFLYGKSSLKQRAYKILCIRYKERNCSNVFIFAYLLWLKVVFILIIFC